MGIWVIETINLLFGCVVSFVLGFVVGFVYLVIVLGCAVYKVFGYVAHKVFVFVKKPIFIMKDRKKTLSSIPDLDMSLVNSSLTPGQRAFCVAAKLIWKAAV